MSEKPLKSPRICRVASIPFASNRFFPSVLACSVFPCIAKSNGFSSALSVILKIPSPDAVFLIAYCNILSPVAFASAACPSWVRVLSTSICCVGSPGTTFPSSPITKDFPAFSAPCCLSILDCICVVKSLGMEFITSCPLACTASVCFVPSVFTALTASVLVAFTASTAFVLAVFIDCSACCAVFPTPCTACSTEDLSCLTCVASLSTSALSPATSRACCSAFPSADSARACACRAASFACSDFCSDNRALVAAVCACSLYSFTACTCSPMPDTDSTSFSTSCLSCVVCCASDLVCSAYSPACFSADSARSADSFTALIASSNNFLSSVASNASGFGLLFTSSANFFSVSPLSRSAI